MSYNKIKLSLMIQNCLEGILVSNAVSILLLSFLPNTVVCFKRLVQLTSESGEVEDLGDDGDTDAPCMHYNCTYISVTPKLANV